MARILVVDDEPSILEFFEILLSEEGYTVDLVSNGREAMEMVERTPYDLVITDLAMPEVDGMAVLERVKEISPETLVLMITAYATAESAVDAMKMGAYDYLLKPFKVDEIRLVIRNALEKSTLRRENTALKQEVNRRKGFNHFIGESEKMQKIFDLIEKVAGGKSSVLIVGESGTGKELVAKAIHENSPRANRPFVSINCGAIPENLIESELFGYQRGAFTGATSNKMGLFEAAHQGTFFLDEVGELPGPIQVKLLRMLQEKTIRRIGSTSSSPVDVRVLSATNRDLEEDVASGRFREDLYYRLNVIQIRLPALRDRPEDIPLLANHFLNKAVQEHGKAIEGISPDALRTIQSYAFPGNVRELENLIEQSVALESGRLIRPESLPERVKRVDLGEIPTMPVVSEAGIDLERTVDELEKKLLMEALRLSGGVKKRAAELLKISFRSMRYRLLKHGLANPDEE
jgi:two-component system response regulator PilR (NtrC family)